MRRLDLAFGAMWLVLGLAVCAMSFSLGVIGPAGPDSGFFPLLAGGAMAGGAALLLASSRHGDPELEAFIPPEGSARRVVLVLATMTGMIAALPWIGFNLAGIVGMPLLLRIVGRPSWTFAVLFGTGATMSVHYVFNTWLGMTLPRGPFGF